MRVQNKDLWSLAIGPPEVDPDDLAEAIEHQAARDKLDFRTRLLIRDSVEALRKHWGQQRVSAWLSGCTIGARVNSICRENLGEPGFSSLIERVMEKTDPEDIRHYLRELGTEIHQQIRLDIGGAAALLLPGYIVRNTTDIDVVNEVPAEVRSLHRKLAELKKRYGLELGHFQSHYLPSGWQQRVHSQGSFGQFLVYLVDVYDVFLGKLFSSRPKDLDDLRALLPQLEKDRLVRKLKETTGPMQAAPDLRQKAEKNWYILFGEPLPS